MDSGSRAGTSNSEGVLRMAGHTKPSSHGAARVRGWRGVLNAKIPALCEPGRAASIGLKVFGSPKRPPTRARWFNSPPDTLLPPRAQYPDNCHEGQPSGDLPVPLLASMTPAFPSVRWTVGVNRPDSMAMRNASPVAPRA